MILSRCYYKSSVKLLVLEPLILNLHTVMEVKFGPPPPLRSLVLRSFCGCFGYMYFYAEELFLTIIALRADNNNSLFFNYLKQIHAFMLKIEKRLINKFAFMGN